MGKGEIARYEQFLLFPQSFSTNLDEHDSATFIKFEIAVCNFFKFGGV